MTVPSSLLRFSPSSSGTSGCAAWPSTAGTTSRSSKRLSHSRTRSAVHWSWVFTFSVFLVFGVFGGAVGSWADSEFFCFLFFVFPKRGRMMAQQEIADVVSQHVWRETLSYYWRLSVVLLCFRVYVFFTRMNL